MKLSDKKKNEIKVLANYLRQELTDYESFCYAVEELFKGEASIDLDSDGQVIVYTAHTADAENEGPMTKLLSGFLMDELELCGPWQEALTR